MPETDYDTAQHMASRMRASNQAFNDSIKDIDERVGISIGCATFPEDGDTIQSLLAAADRRLYEEKNTRPKTR